MVLLRRIVASTSDSGFSDISVRTVGILVQSTFISNFNTTSPISSICI